MSDKQKQLDAFVRLAKRHPDWWKRPEHRKMMERMFDRIRAMK